MLTFSKQTKPGGIDFCISKELKKSEDSGFERVKQNVKVTEKYRLENFDLITWFLVSV